MEQKVLKLFIEHARGFLSALEELTETESTSKIVEAEKQSAQQSTKEAPPKADAGNAEMKGNDESRGGIPTAEELANLTFNDLRSLGAKLGVKSGGRRSEIEANILALADKKAAAKTESPEKESSSKNESKNDEAKSTEDDVEEEADEDEIREACEKMTDEELQELLKSVGQRTSGKRTALIDRIVKAVADEVLDWKDDGEGSDEDEGGDAKEEDDGLDYEEFPELAVNDPEQYEITKERLEKLEEIDVICESDEEGEGEDVVNEFLTGYFGSRFNVKKFGLRQKTVLYYEVMKLFVDDDGDEHTEKEGYYLNNELYCCAKPVDETGKCLVCNDVYEIEEEA